LLALRELEDGIWFRPSSRPEEPELHLSVTHTLPNYLRDGWPAQRNLSLFLVGDSLERVLASSACFVDWRQVEATYLRRERQPGCAEQEWKDESFGCRRSLPGEPRRQLAVANLFFRGTLDEVAHRLCELGLPPSLAGLLEAGSAAFRATFGEPQLVLLKSHFWEVDHLCFTQTFPCADLGDNWAAASTLLARYEANLRGMLAQLRSLFPGAVVALKVDARWNVSGSRFLSRSTHPGVPNRAANALWLSAQLDGAVRRVARSERAPLFDLHRMTEALEPAAYLKDDIHLSHDFSRLAVNMLLHAMLRSPA
jgi:hypothetical protein